jgi:hypothetical protein
MTHEQVLRAPRLLALAVVIDDRRAGRATPADILQLAGPLTAEMPEGDGQLVCEATVLSQGGPEDATTESETSPASDHASASHRTKTIVRVSARFVRHVSHR